MRKRFQCWLVWLGALVLVGALTGCVSADQRRLASELHLTALESETKLLDWDQKLTNAIDARDAGTVELMIQDADGMLRAWRKQSDQAQGEVREAADQYQQALKLRIQMYEAGSRTVLYHSVEDSRAAVRFQVDAYDLSNKAIDHLKALAP
jgi:hypothetical protein